MKHIKNENEKVNSEKLSIKKVGTIIGSGAICCALAGVISISGLFDKNTDSVKKDENTSEKVSYQAENNTAETTTVNEIPAVTYTTLDTVVWKKASINEYEIAQTQASSAVSKATTKKTAAQTTKTTEKNSAKTTKAASAKKKAASKKQKTTVVSKIMYTTDSVNMREKPNTHAIILNILDKGERVMSLKKLSTGWIQVKYNGQTGYISSRYLSTKAPAKKTNKKKTQTTQNNTQNNYNAQSTNSGAISYTNEELNMLAYVLQGEVGNCSEASKLAVANVIINRVKSPNFPNTISGVLTSGNQFTAISGYYNGTTPPTESTLNCAKRALNGEDNSNGATYYYAPQYCGGSTGSWFETLTFCMELEGQRFFK